MTPTRRGSLRLFRLFGIEVFLHWSWFLVALYEIQGRGHSYGALFWNALEYLALFAIVLLHEFGHALACRQVGGRADQIVLWPLGGVAYVSPPQRPGAMLWSIAAGPLVNVILAPILTVLVLSNRYWDWAVSMPNAYTLLQTVWLINLFLLIFNVMPIYPLDGGQILRSLLWFVFGRARSLLIATSVGLIGVAGLIGFAIWHQSVWLGILSAFIVLNCWSGFVQARALMRLARLPQREGYACPQCGIAPPVGTVWICGKCRQNFDMFESHAACPHCGTQYAATTCLECGELSPVSEWAGRVESLNP
jgi:Zn-dependent protease